MKKNYNRKFTKKKKGFIERFKNDTYKYVMIYITHKILVMLKSHLNYLKDNIFECFFKKYNFFKKINFFITYNDGKLKT